MPITEYQKEQRQKHIGSSDMAAILGVDPYANAYDKWLEKTGKVEPFKGNEATKIGDLSEPGLLLFAERKLGPIIRNQYRSHPALPLGANIDAIVKSSSEPIDAKTSGLLSPLSTEWGEDGTDDVPTGIIIQAHVHMMCLAPIQVERCWVPALLGGRGLNMFQIIFNQELADVITDEALVFWQCVECDTPPADVSPSLSSLKRIRRIPDKIGTVSKSAVDALRMAKSAMKDAKERLDIAQTQVLREMGDTEAAFADGHPGQWFTYKEQTRKGYEVKASTFRTLRESKIPKGIEQTKGESHDC